MLKKLFFATASIIALISINGCSSVFSSQTEVIEVASNPEGASITITNRKGDTVYKGVTPIKQELAKAEGFFKGEDYAVHIEKGGFRAVDVVITSHNNGWYVFGNTLNAFLPGWLIVDPKTKDMYRLDPKKILVDLVPLNDDANQSVSLREIKGNHQFSGRKFK